MLVCFPRAEPPIGLAASMRGRKPDINLQGGYGFGRENKQMSTTMEDVMWAVSFAGRPACIQDSQPASQ